MYGQLVCVEMHQLRVPSRAVVGVSRTLKGILQFMLQGAPTTELVSLRSIDEVAIAQLVRVDKNQLMRTFSRRCWCFPGT
jgi:hypothetical protein